ncbi:MAG: conjugal transfer protein TraB [Burkholderiales bacterium PBB5]|nr:MAG: conjugal transfer protein TraB [Burkholderiales bacterium PBB5]
MGGAGKELAKVKDQLKTADEERQALRSELKQTRDQFVTEMNALRERGLLPGAPTAAPSPTVAPLGLIPIKPASAPDAAAAKAGAPNNALVSAPGNATGTAPMAAKGPVSFPAQKTDRLPAPNQAVYPPGTPLGQAGNAAGQGALQQVPDPYVPSLIRVSMAAPKAGEGASVPAAPGAQGSPGAPGAKVPRTLNTFLPVGFTRAVLLGGLAAPTGGQAQANPVPVLLRMADLSVLPNGYRAMVKDCLVIGEGYGEHSAERAYIRATLLSCVMRDGQVLEVPIKGSVFGEDGMNGMMGKLVTKQGAILGNALLAGIASGIGSGIAQASQITTTTALGSVSTPQTDTSSILKQGFGTGVGKALDRLAQYYINLAERTFPIIEVLPGRIVDVVIQQGVTLDVALASIGPAITAPTSRGASPDNDRSALMKAARGEDDD